MADMDKYAVFGNPIKQSKSPAIHTAFAGQCDHRLQYRAVRVEEDDFERATRAFFSEGGRGLNVTVPFKQEAFALADRLSDRARRAGAVNTLSVAEDGAIEGDNTDGVGIVRDMVANLGWMVQGMRVLIIGAGGAVRGVLAPLMRERPKSLLVVNRTAARATQLAEEFSDLGAIEGGGYDLIDERQFDLVINASSAGLSGEAPDLPAGLLTEHSCCYDMVYGNEPTPFMRWAAHHAAWAVADGLGMLVEQAAESFYIWRRVRPETQSVISELRLAMEAA
ncbi:shikimate dehydrogenase (NADP(+)) [Halioglobus japonicus]|uniref:Shikimate dehydrogenase (NADP(+)) n=1 Tax=Halioglobus japonicus TaxID=930805 RepID=A0AAP8MDQ0_9GAMM|nr:shikimate dehydrogenase [Halioglobus japonicus]PLW85931.1 shikimate dehydrogenase [Halioglobus japonicus]GHD24075.1 shikimate dehydrogenase (NADP(+)) [Halioglobus japonicus]